MNFCAESDPGVQETVLVSKTAFLSKLCSGHSSFRPRRSRAEAVNAHIRESSLQFPQLLFNDASHQSGLALCAKIHQQ